MLITKVHHEAHEKLESERAYRPAVPLANLSPKLKEEVGHNKDEKNTLDSKNIWEVWGFAQPWTEPSPYILKCWYQQNENGPAVILKRLVGEQYLKFLQDLRPCGDSQVYKLGVLQKRNTILIHPYYAYLLYAHTNWDGEILGRLY